MRHAKPRAGLRTRALPALLMSAVAAAFGGLVALAPVQADRPTVLAYADAAPLVLDEPAVQERAQARASRDRRMDEQARAKAAAQARAAAAAKAAAEAKAKAAAQAKAAAAAKAKRTAASRGALRISGRCPVPNASFTDTWGAPRGGGRSHQGTDLLAPYGSPVYAVANGTVRDAYSDNGGISLYLEADNGETYFYAHNSANVVKGGRVEAGQLIARVGSTGNAGGTNHVHFEREVGGRSVNPYSFLRGIC